MAAGGNETDGRSFLQNTSIFGLNVSALLGISIGCAIIFVLLIIFSCCWTRKVRKRTRRSSSLIPVVSKEITDINAADQSENDDKLSPLPKQEVKTSNEAKRSECRSSESNTYCGSVSSSSAVSTDLPHFGWGRWYSLRELELATDEFSSGNVIGEGGYGIVYRGILPDTSIVAIKNLLNNKGQAEREFKVEVEAIGKVRHKNLVGLIGYCAEGPQRMLVYEYLDNGNLEQWLHGDVGSVSPLTWNIRMKIALGTAKGLAYLHEGLEPKVVHRDIKSSNILLDR